MHPEWRHQVHDYTTLALYKTKEPVFVRGAASPPPYNSCPPPPPPPRVFSHEFLTHDVESKEPLQDLGLRVVRGVGQSKELEDWYHIVTNSRGIEPDAAWDLRSNAHSRGECLADAKLPRQWGSRPGKLATVLGTDPLKRAGEQCSAWWPAMRDLFPTQRSCIAAGEDAWSRPDVLMSINCHVRSLPRVSYPIISR